MAAISIGDVRYSSKFFGLTVEQAKKAGERAIRRALIAARTQATKEMAKEYAIKQRRVAAKVTLGFRSSKYNTYGRVTWRGYALNLADFTVSPGKPNPAKRPILRATVARSRGPVPYKGAFLVNLRAGGTKVFRRTTEAKDYGLRLPITGVWGPSIPQLLGGGKVRHAIEDRATKIMDQRLDYEIKQILRKR